MSGRGRPRNPDKLPPAERVALHKARRDASRLPRTETLHRMSSAALAVLWPRLDGEAKAVAVEAIRLEAHLRDLDADGTVAMVERLASGSITHKRLTKRSLVDIFVAMEADMGTNVESFVGALEAQVAALLAEVAAAKAEGLRLMGVIDDMSDDDFLGAWDRMEAEYGTLFGPRGVYPEIPRRRMSVIVRLEHFPLSNGHTRQRQSSSGSLSG